ncbi:hypothetical protein Skr01_22780 [Sphaerisporangium krabiense]|uniref:Secreted protein n=1 Tax=Sphaerisporangium krabiense TaxID=763782 RepID=A0A7W9DR32_9ACTN|nr:hypothetical protein [Sphaerisporangium krabiense]MBB5628028.1 hypothetical protein [Sphaerisporangium krabiense]GII62193.1 hypothetical protein Skr01_22780 [Sphaerisporangium krabiense]
MISTKVPIRIAAGALAAAAVLAPAAAQAAGPSPYAQAAAAVKGNGTLAYGKNIVSVSRITAGRYCVQVGKDIDLSKEVVQITLWNDFGKTVGAFMPPQSACKNEPSTILVPTNSVNPPSANVDTAFFLSIP